MTEPSFIKALKRPEVYPHPVKEVEFVQTHISYVFIAGEYTYKIKKPINFGFLDFSDLEKRHFYCQEEIRLNRRLASPIYLGLTPIYEDMGKKVYLDNPPEQAYLVDYAVKMKTLPKDSFLQNLLAQGKISPLAMQELARILAEFHNQAATGAEINLGGDIHSIYQNLKENFEQTKNYVGLTINRKTYDLLQEYSFSFLRFYADLLRKRLRDGKIRECHGDLRLEHICLWGDQIYIFDCIEFNRRFRYNDVTAEVAFLAMDLDFNEYPDFSQAFIKWYIEYSEDRDLLTLLNFYKCYYAYTRGKIEDFSLDDREMEDVGYELMVERAKEHFDLALSYAARPNKPALFLVGGLTGTGKSHLAKNLAPRLGARVIRTDVLRKKLSSQPIEKDHKENFGKGIYSPEMSQKTYQIALTKAEETLLQGTYVLIDATFQRRTDRQAAFSMAERLGADFLFLECRCPENIIKNRLEDRELQKEDVSDADWKIYLKQKEVFEQITELPANKHLIINTENSEQDNLDYVLEQLVKKQIEKHSGQPDT